MSCTNLYVCWNLHFLRHRMFGSSSTYLIALEKCYIFEFCGLKKLLPEELASPECWGSCRLEKNCLHGGYLYWEKKTSVCSYSANSWLWIETSLNSFMMQVLAADEFWPVQGGKAPDVSQVRQAIDAILSSQRWWWIEDLGSKK